MQSRELIVGVTGGIAAYKTADLVSKLMQAGANVSVVMTTSAQQFVGATTFEALTNRPVCTSMFDVQEHYRGEHIGLAERAELMIVSPATANYIAKLANGIADDLLSTLALTITCPLLLAPAMNKEMWSKPAVERNIDQIKKDGVQIIEPTSGWLSCGQVGLGRMAEPSEILKQIEQTFLEK